MAVDLFQGQPEELAAASGSNAVSAEAEEAAVRALLAGNTGGVAELSPRF